MASSTAVEEDLGCLGPLIIGELRSLTYLDGSELRRDLFRVSGQAGEE